MSKFEWYRPEVSELFMSLGKHRIGLSKKLFDNMGKPKYIQLGYWDKEKSIIIKPCSEDSEYKIEIKSGKYPPRINNKGFIKFIIGKGIKLEDKAKKYKAMWNEEDKVGYIKINKREVS